MSRKTKAAQLLEFAKSAADNANTWVDVHNAVFGIGGKAIELFPDSPSRTKLIATDEYKQIQELIGSLKGSTGTPPAEASGKFLVRLPKTVHAALAAEAEAEGVSLNQLCVAKLSLQLRALV